jgi:geranylgeranyl diphosphate synthase type I
LNLIGDFEKYKKEIGGDISEGKRTLMVVHSLSKASKEDKNKLISILSSHTKDPSQIKVAIAILKKTGSIDYAIAFSKKLITDAKSQLDSLTDSQYKKDLLLLADYFVSREQ